jgi:lipoyl-dependent peroxiredoxin
MPARTSKAVWNGDLQSGTGQMVVGNNAYTGDFSFKSRFEEGAGTCGVQKSAWVADQR